MTKVYPNYAAATSGKQERETSNVSSTSSNIDHDHDHDTAVILTVWKKSLLLNCNGFTVFNAQGNLVYRVDNYIPRNKDHILLMDAQGTPLLTICRRKRLSLGDNWVVYEGEREASSVKKPMFTARKQVNGKCLAQMLIRSPDNKKKKKKEVAYVIQGSYSQRCCTIYNNKTRRVVAEIKRKEAAVVVAGGVACFGDDVFRLIVQPENEIDTTLSMAFLIILDHMFP